jgi:hypothetical protein
MVILAKKVKGKSPGHFLNVTGPAMLPNNSYNN